MSTAHEHYRALAEECQASAVVWGQIRDAALEESATYPARSVGGRVQARVAHDAAVHVGEWQKRAEGWLRDAAEVPCTEGERAFV